jgi:hypothetical protein
MIYDYIHEILLEVCAFGFKATSHCAYLTPDLSSARALRVCGPSLLARCYIGAPSATCSTSSRMLQAGAFWREALCRMWCILGLSLDATYWSRARAIAWAAVNAATGLVQQKIRAARATFVSKHAEGVVREAAGGKGLTL